jgi:cell division cycle 14
MRSPTQSDCSLSCADEARHIMKCSERHRTNVIDNSADAVGMQQVLDPKSDSCKVKESFKKSSSLMQNCDFADDFWQQYSGTTMSEDKAGVKQSIIFPEIDASIVQSRPNQTISHHEKSHCSPKQNSTVCQNKGIDFISNKEEQNESPFAHEVFDRVCVAQYLNRFTPTKRFRCFRPDLQYHSFCDDFGPMNFSSIARFIRQLDAELSAHPTCKIVYCADAGRRALTNAVFLLGAYMLLKLGMAADAVYARFAWLRPAAVEAYRDASYAPPDFPLTLLDCWRGLDRGRRAGWVAMPAAPGSPWWGRTDVDRYEHYDDPLNGDMHVVVPGRLIALPGPVDLPCGADYSDAGGRRVFGPGHCAAALRGAGAAAVVRLCEPEYDPAALAVCGLAHVDLPFPDGAAPPDRVVRAFLAAVDAAPGPVAVHCRAGLGRTGTLIGVYLMEREGFTAREAMGWLRIMRPGSVVGAQQRYLCEAEAALGRRRAAAAAAAAAIGAGAAAGRRGCRSAFLPRARPRAGGDGGGSASDKTL